MVREPVRDFKVALAFLTRVRVDVDEAPDPGSLAASAPLFPVVGALIGLAGGAVYVLAFYAGLTSFLAAILATATLALITGGLHEDGLADVADGFGGGRTRDDKLAIMRDSRLGTFGALTLVLVVLARIGALATLALPATVVPVMIAAAATSRAVLPAVLTLLPGARAEGLAVAAGRPHPARAAAAGLIAALLAVLLIPSPVVAGGLLAAVAAAAVMAELARRQIGGVTGDVLGALQQVAEIAFLLAIVAFRS